uniref:Uncharacterized protein n=1 Tax=Pararge aegeria TaxID=116150 RepID=S4NV77_9NEOP
MHTLVRNPVHATVDTYASVEQSGKGCVPCMPCEVSVSSLPSVVWPVNYYFKKKFLLTLVAYELLSTIEIVTFPIF